MAEQAKVPAIRFAGFTDPWEQRKLGAGDYDYWRWHSQYVKPNYWDGEIDWYSSRLMFSRTRCLMSIFLKPLPKRDWKNLLAQIVPENSIAVVTHVGVGKLIYLPFQYSTSQDFISLCGLKGDARCLFCLCAEERIQEDLHIVQASAIKGITKEDLLEKNFNA